MCTENVRAHFQRENRHRQDETDPEPARHIDKLGIGAGIGTCDVRFERHAADRARAGANLPDLGVHRAGVDRAVRHGLRLRVTQIFLRTAYEFRAAAGRAKIIRMAAVLRPVLGRVRIDSHAAHRIDHAVFRVVMMVMSGSHAYRLAPNTPRGYIAAMAKDSKPGTLKRLNRIEGQVRGLARMVEDERYCIDIVTQIGAVRAALRRVEEEILRDHVAHCVDHAIKSGNKADQRRKVAELMDVMGRAGR